MSKNAQEAAQEIYSYISTKCIGKNYSNYYIGISNDPRERLFNQHNVEENNCWIYVKTINDAHARNVEKYFIDKGMKGGGGGGDETSVYVYCYQITSNTKE